MDFQTAVIPTLCANLSSFPTSNPPIPTMIASTSCAPVRTGSRLGLIVLAVLASIAGCEKTAPTETPAASSQAISPRAMLRQMADAYKGCTSYEDAGELHIVPDGGAEEEPQPFAVALERPNKA